MKVCLIGGLGRVGLVTGVTLSEPGNEVVCVDADKEGIERLGDGLLPFYDPGLDQMVARNRANGRLSFATDLREALTAAGGDHLSLRRARLWHTVHGCEVRECDWQ